MSTKKRTLGITVFSSVMIAQGVIMALVVLWSFFRFSKTLEFFDDYAFLNSFFYYYIFPNAAVIFLLILRLILAVAQITAGLLFLNIKKQALLYNRILVFFGISTALINPFYSGTLLLIALIVYGVMIFYLFQERIVRIFQNEKVEDSVSIVTGQPIDGAPEDQDRKSLATLLIGITEFLFALMLLRFSFWDIALKGFDFPIPTRIGFNFSLPIYKAEIFFLGIFVLIAGIRTITFKPSGRILTIFLGAVSALISVFCIIVINPAKLANLKAYYGIWMVFLSLFTLMSILIMSNPRVRDQFMQRQELKFRWKLLILGKIVVACFIGAFVMNLIFETAPNFFDKRQVRLMMPRGKPLKDMVPQEEQTDDALAGPQVVTLSGQQQYVQELEWKRLSKQFMTLYQNMKYTEAEEVGKKAVKLAEETFGKNNFNLTVSLNNLGLLYMTMKKYPQSEELLNQSLEINQRVFGAEDTRVATDLNNLAEVYRIQEKYDDAIFLYNRALKILIKNFGEDHPTVEITKKNLEILNYEKEEKKNAALKAQEQVEPAPVEDVIQSPQFPEEQKIEEPQQTNAELVPQAAP